MNGKAAARLIIAAAISAVIGTGAVVLLSPADVQADEASTSYTEIVNEVREDGTKLKISESPEVEITDGSVPDGEKASIGPAELIEAESGLGTAELVEVS